MDTWRSRQCRLFLELCVKRKVAGIFSRCGGAPSGHVLRQCWNLAFGLMRSHVYSRQQVCIYLCACAQLLSVCLYIGLMIKLNSVPEHGYQLAPGETWLCLSVCLSHIQLSYHHALWRPTEKRLKKYVWRPLCIIDHKTHTRATLPLLGSCILYCIQLSSVSPFLAREKNYRYVFVKSPPPPQHNRTGMLSIQSYAKLIYWLRQEQEKETI